MPDTNPRLQIVSEDTLRLEFSGAAGPELLATICAARDALVAHFPDQLIEVLPSYTTITLVVDFPNIYPQQLLAPIANILRDLDSKPRAIGSNAALEIPVYYGPEVALDLDDIARRKSLSRDEIIRLHSGVEYRVYALGFSPGFAFLGFVNETLSCPRHSSPRANVAAGSVGIADRQTGIYPLDSPGGWNIVGRTPIAMFHPQQTPENMCPLKVGDAVKFVSVEREEFIRLGGTL